MGGVTLSGSYYGISGSKAGVVILKLEIPEQFYHAALDVAKLKEKPLAIHIIELKEDPA